MTTNIEVQEARAPQAREAEATSSRRVLAPNVDILEREDGLVIAADLPGVDEKGIEVTLENNVLSFTGRPAIQEPQGYEGAATEFAAAGYGRSFTIADDVDREKITAAIKNGVLRITLPKSAAAQPRKIEVASK